MGVFESVLFAFRHFYDTLILEGDYSCPTINRMTEINLIFQDIGYRLRSPIVWCVCVGNGAVYTICLVSVKCWLKNLFITKNITDIFGADTFCTQFKYHLDDRCSFFVHEQVSFDIGIALVTIWDGSSDPFATLGFGFNNRTNFFCLYPVRTIR